MIEKLLFKVRNDRGVCHQKYNKKMNLWSFEPWVRTQVTSYKQGKKGSPKCMGLLIGEKSYYDTNGLLFTQIWNCVNFVEMEQAFISNFESDYFKGIVLININLQDHLLMQITKRLFKVFLCFWGQGFH